MNKPLLSVTVIANTLSLTWTSVAYYISWPENKTVNIATVFDLTRPDNCETVVF